MHSSIDKIHPMRNLIKLMKLCGLWTFKRNTFNFYYKCYTCAIHFIFTFPLITLICVKVIFAKNLDERFGIIYMAFTELAMLVKFVNMVRKSKAFISILEIFEKNKFGFPKTVEEEKIVLEGHMTFQRIVNIYFFGALFTISCGLITPMLKGFHELPYAIWTPFEYRNSFLYFILFIYEIIGMPLTALTNQTADMTQCYLMLHLTFYYKILGVRLQRIHETDSGLRQKNLKDLFEFHSFTSRLADYCEELVSVPIMGQIIFSALILCFTAYRLQSLSFFADPSLFLMLVTFAGVMSMQIYLPCTYGDNLCESSRDVMNSTYNSNWMDLRLGEQKLIYQFMESLKRPKILRAGNIFAIGLGVFTQTMSTAYRFYALMMNMEQ